MFFLSHTNWLGIFIELFFKSSIIAGLAFILVFLLRKHSASSRNLVLTLSMAGLLVLPFTINANFGWNTGIPSFQTGYIGEKIIEEPVLIDHTSNSPGMDEMLSTSPETTFKPSPTQETKTTIWTFLITNVSSLFIFAWIMGIMFYIIRISTGIYGTSRFIHRGNIINEYPWENLLSVFLNIFPIRRRVRLVQSRGCIVPMTYGLISPVVAIPPDSSAWTVEKSSSVLFHELAHVKRWDFGVRIMAQIAFSIYWFNPLCRELYRRLIQEQEIACDEMVLRMGIKPSIYAGHLLEMRRIIENEKPYYSFTPGMAAPFDFTKRITNILNNHKFKKEIKMKTKILIMLIIIIAVIFIGTAKADNAFSSGPVHNEKPDLKLQNQENPIMQGKTDWEAFEKEYYNMMEQDRIYRNEVKRIKFKSQKVEAAALLIEEKRKQEKDPAILKKLDEETRAIEKKRLSLERKRIAAEQLKVDEFKMQKMGEEVHRRTQKRFRDIDDEAHKNLKTKDSRLLAMWLANGWFSEDQMKRFYREVENDRKVLPANFEIIVYSKEDYTHVGIYCPSTEPLCSDALIKKMISFFRKYTPILGVSRGKEVVNFVLGTPETKRKKVNK